jgi:hypothetical protein
MHGARYSFPILMKLELPPHFFQKYSYQMSFKLVQWEPSSMRTDRRTDMTKLIFAFRNFANAPKNG